MWPPKVVTRRSPVGVVMVANFQICVTRLKARRANSSVERTSRTVTCVTAFWTAK